MDLGRAYARAGRRAAAERVLADLQAFGRREYTAPFQLAVIYAALGDKDRAFDALGQTIAARSWYATWLRADPSFDTLRPDPRFARLLETVNFPAP